MSFASKNRPQSLIPAQSTFLRLLNVTAKSIVKPVCLLAVFATSAVFAEQSVSGDAQWQNTLDKAKGQTVYFNAWGGSETINDYIRWAADHVQKKYQVTVKQVKVTDTGNVVSRLLAEKTAGRNEKGSVDLVWINGENFKSMKDNGLLAKAYTQQLPNYALVDTENQPSTLYDFTTPVDNLEAPWGMAQLIFMYDSKYLQQPPKNMRELLAVAGELKGRVTYPAPPSFYGTSFIKQALLELTETPAALTKPVTEADFEKVTAPLWLYLDKLHPLMWRKGNSFPEGGPQMKKLLNDGEILISLSFNPNDASNAIANDELPKSIKTYVHEKGSLGNTHFVAVPFNSSAKAGAMVFANFLMSAEAQVKKADPNVWGDPTVLAINKLNSQQQTAFSKLPIGEATLTPEQLGNVLLEPHASWVQALEKAWLARYAQ